MEDIKIDVLVTPEQWDALGRIGAPGSLASGAQKAMAARRVSRPAMRRQSAR
ncbi:hypothetical protein [Streptomyces sp. CNQ085]|uniref:hypothetical protein n=1 Tax=Streptomyces sp. CNQ085 TaxID=2886944 RepID=UPI001F50BB55|nr:hypothetical protein [Streptomyces sp. CNQ085]MCI0386045.1 hypothetical protein [Streptomyces sp. CNQ085]